MNQLTPESGRNSHRPDLGKTYPVGHASGRIWQPPTSVKQARARVAYQMDHLEANCREGIDTPYAIQCLGEAQDDYFQMVVHGNVDEGRAAALEAEIGEIVAETGKLATECAELQAEVAALEAMRRDIDGGAA
jgi:hypothetical protein